MSFPNMRRTGPWKALFPRALQLMDHLESVTEQPQWTFGGGTVLMLRHNHRQSKDIDLFVPDPQYLGYVNPRISDVAESISDRYQSGALYVKLIFDEGEIDIVVGPSLTTPGYDLVSYKGRKLRVETSAEIIAKKMWHRGHESKARDLFDLCSVAIAEPAAIDAARPFFGKHAAAFLQGLEANREQAKRDFEAIIAVGEPPDFDESLELARRILLDDPHRGKKQAGKT